MTHPLTDEMIESIWDNVGSDIVNTEDKDLDRFVENSLMRNAYDLGKSKGRAEMLDDVLEWLGKNLSNPKYSDITEEHKIISGQVEQFSYIITDAIQDDLLEAMRPQEDK